MSWTKREPKRIPGRRIKSVAEFSRAVERGDYIFWRGKCYHPKVLANWSVAMIQGMVVAKSHWDGGFNIAKLNPKHPYHVSQIRILWQNTVDVFEENPKFWSKFRPTRKILNQIRDRMRACEAQRRARLQTSE